MEMKITAIIQARMGSTRLPGKVLLSVSGKTMLEYVIERVSRAQKVNEVIVATTADEDDAAVVHVADKLGVGVFCGDENDVLDRYYRAARKFHSDHIVRITADCPLIDPAVIDNVIEMYFSQQADYCSNILKESFPDGEDVEIFSLSALEQAQKEAKLPSEREHVTPHIKNNPEKFKLVNLRNEHDLSSKRWTLDEKEDFEFLKNILARLYPDNADFHMEDVLQLLKENPELENINSGIIRNEGYQKSIKEHKG